MKNPKISNENYDINKLTNDSINNITEDLIKNGAYKACLDFLDRPGVINKLHGLNIIDISKAFIIKEVYKEFLDFLNRNDVISKVDKYGIQNISQNLIKNGSYKACLDFLKIENIIDKLDGNCINLIQEINTTLEIKELAVYNRGLLLVIKNLLGGEIKDDVVLDADIIKMLYYAALDNNVIKHFGDGVQKPKTEDIKYESNNNKGNIIFDNFNFENNNSLFDKIILKKGLTEKAALKIDWTAKQVSISHKYLQLNILEYLNIEDLKKLANTFKTFSEDMFHKIFISKGIYVKNILHLGFYNISTEETLASINSVAEIREDNKIILPDTCYEDNLVGYTAEYHSEIE